MRVAPLLAAVLLVACHKPKTVPVPDPGRDTSSASAHTHELEQRVGRLEVQRLERDAQVDQLQTTGGANVREGPGAAFHVAFTLEAGVSVTGISWVDQWVRVTDDSSRSGWVFYSLVGRRADTSR